MNKTVPNLVLTISNGLSARQLTPFVRTFKNRVRKGKLVVLTGKIDTEAKELLESIGADLVPFRYFSIRMRHFECLLWPLWKRVFSVLGSGERKRVLARRVFNLFFLRSLLYLDYLESLTEKPAWVFMTDCRDVVFQEDIFEEIREPALYCFLEGKGRTIAACPSNSRMLTYCFGQKALHELGTKEPSCAGTVLGDYPHVHEYLQKMVSYAMKIEKMRMVPGDDQGLHNYLVQRNLTSGVRLVDNDLGPVGTMGCVPAEEIRLSEQSLVLQADGRPYAVLHQHDRHPRLKALFDGEA